MAAWPPSIENLSKYLTSPSTVEWSYFRQNCGGDLPWNGATCLAIICYAIKLCSDSEHVSDIIMRLDDSCSEFFDREIAVLSYSSGQVEHEMETAVWEKDFEICQLFENCFRPEVHIFFTVPQLHQLSNKDKSLKMNEILAGFIDFLLQILNSEAVSSSDKEQRYAILQKELTFILTFLGDTPFWYTDFEDVKNLSLEFENLANEVGRFIYSCVLATPPIDEGRDALLQRFEILNLKVKYHCIKFSEFPKCATQRGDAFDLLFIVDSLLEDLENLMIRRFYFTADHIKDHINALHEVLTSCGTLLLDNGELQVMDTDELIESHNQIRDGVYEAEYLINTHVVGNLPIWYLNIRLPAVTQKINLTRKKLQEVKNFNEGSKVVRVFCGEVSSQAKKTPRTKVDNVIIGFEDNKTKILGDLIGGSRKLETISIFGMPGLGKTTITNELYCDRSVYDYFDKRVWCVVSQIYEKRKVLIDILMSLERKPDKNGNLNMEDECLGLAIYQSLKGRRYLIVLDDVWHSTTWDDLRRYFPDDRIGSRIMLTSRIKDRAPTNSISHTLPLLSEVQCWNLLVRKAIGEGPCSPQLLGIAKRIAENCHGLPLAVVVIAGILANLEKKESVWKKVERNLESYICDDPSDYMKILHLSYEHLSNHLKLCFLYMGAFPEDTEISMRKLICLLIAEGFVQKKDGKCPEHVAEEYIIELINRSLLMIARKRFDGGIKSCRMHDLLRDMCLRKANGENFLKPIKDYSSIYEKHYRLCAITTPTCSWSIFGLHCRSFSGYLPAPASRLPQMPLLRVMDLFPTAYSHNELKRIDLVHLRYLAIGGMPESIHKLISLEYLCIETEVKVHVPLSILKTLSMLRHLRIARRAKFEVEGCDSSQETHMLKSLSYVQIYKHDDEEVLRCSPHLRKLKCVCNETLFPNLRFVNELESLNMTFKGYFSGELENVVIPLTLKKLHLQGTGLPWEKMSIVGRLPNLGGLKLCYDAFVGEEWVTVDGEFQELRLLKLEEISLKKWIACREHFPKLQNLVLKSCRNLSEIPSELGDVPTLQTIEVNDCSRDACLSAIRIEKAQLEYGNEELKVIISLHQWSKDELLLQEVSN